VHCPAPSSGCVATVCDAGSCGEIPLGDGIACPGGVCDGGTCAIDPLCENDVLDAPNDDAVIARVRDAVSAQCRKYPVYG